MICDADLTLTCLKGAPTGWIHLYRTYISSQITFIKKPVECTLPPPPNCTHSRKNTSRSLLLILKSCQRMCHNYVFILSLQLEKKNLYFVFIWEKKRVHLLEVLCVYLNSHCNFFIYENIVAVSSFMLSVGQTFGCF